MARRKSSYRSRRSHRTKNAKRSRRYKRTRRVRRARRGGDGSIGTPYPAARMMPLNPNQTLDGRYFSRANQIGGGGSGSGAISPAEYSSGSKSGVSTSPSEVGVLQPSGSRMVVGGKDGQMATYGRTGGRF
jgi:hypothetical protein